jgi:transcriptional regulator with XRE-family HTH domain
MGGVLRRERRERDLTLKELAGRSALSVVYLSEIERGKKYPSASVLESLARALQLELPELLERLAAALRAAPEAAGAAPAHEPARTQTRPRATVRRTLHLVEREEQVAAEPANLTGTAPVDLDRPDTAVVPPESTHVAPDAASGLRLLAA